jgi:hypothetical protein
METKHLDFSQAGVILKLILPESCTTPLKKLFLQNTFLKVSMPCGAAIAKCGMLN